MTQLTLDQVKTQIPVLQAAIKKVLKVSAGKQSAYHIFAVSHGFTNDQHMKAELAKSPYSITTNLGTVNNPCMINHELGLFLEDFRATQEAEAFLRSCQKNLEWELMKNGDPTGKYIQSITRPEQGLHLIIEIEDDNKEKMLQELEGIVSLVKGGNYHEGGNNFSFTLSGEEYDVINDITCLAEDKSFIIFDSNGIIASDNSTDFIANIWKDSDNAIEEWSGNIIHAELVELSEALENDEQVYHAISRQSGTIYSGEIMDILDSLRYEKHEFSLFMELDRA